MIIEISHKKILLIASFLFLAFLSRSQIRTDGYYYSIRKEGAGTLIKILQFRENGLSIDSIAYDTLPLLRNGLVKGFNRMNYSVARDGEEIIITFEHLNRGPYDVSSCPCKQKIRMANDGFLSVAWRQKDKGWKKAKDTFFFMPFTNN
ncbi:MAG TPA: hypothetical protein VFP97_09685 [Chitinophagaceae bacterium]|nr:hypothetical protein [Chitinophagaceae bacterium]